MMCDPSFGYGGSRTRDLSEPVKYNQPEKEYKRKKCKSCVSKSKDLMCKRKKDNSSARVNYKKK